MLASNTVRPGQIFRVHVHLIKSPHPLAVRSSLSCDGVEVAAAFEELDAGMNTVMLLQVKLKSRELFFLSKRRIERPVELMI